jgi:hypothetical protein
VDVYGWVKAFHIIAVIAWPASRPVVLEGDLLFGKGKLKKVDAAFLEAYCQHFQEVGHGIFQKMYDQQPSRYFDGLIASADCGPSNSTG